ncbi:kinesin light chain, partial [Trifolium medium]|nr:kinesin light chain [Trifolium medium]
MPGIVTIEGNKMNELENPSPSKKILNQTNSPRIPFSPQSVERRDVKSFHCRSRSSQSFGSDSDWSITDSDFSYLDEVKLRNAEFEMEKKMEKDSNSETPTKSRAKVKSSHTKPPIEKKNDNNNLRKQNTTVTTRATKPKSGSIVRSRSQSRVENSKESPTFDNPELGPFLLKQARDLISLGENPQKALEYSLQAMKMFEKSA